MTRKTHGRLLRLETTWSFLTKWRHRHGSRLADRTGDWQPRHRSSDWLYLGNSDRPDRRVANRRAYRARPRCPTRTASGWLAAMGRRRRLGLGRWRWAEVVVEHDDLAEARAVSLQTVAPGRTRDPTSPRSPLTRRDGAVANGAICLFRKERRAAGPVQLTPSDDNRSVVVRRHEDHGVLTGVPLDLPG